MLPTGQHCATRRRFQSAPNRINGSAAARQAPLHSTILKAIPFSIKRHLSPGLPSFVISTFVIYSFMSHEAVSLSPKPSSAPSSTGHQHVQATDIPATLPSALSNFLASNGLDQDVYSAANDIRRHIRINPRRPINTSDIAVEVLRNLYSHNLRAPQSKF